MNIYLCYIRFESGKGRHETAFSKDTTHLQNSTSRFLPVMYPHEPLRLLPEQSPSSANERINYKFLLQCNNLPNCRCSVTIKPSNISSTY